jgi:hypothetical protein
MLLNYDDFLIKENFVTLEQAKGNLLMAVAKQCGSLEEQESLSFFINEGFTNDLFDIATSLDESFAEKFKEMAIKAKERAKELGKAAKDKMSAGAQAALKFGGKITGALKWILGKIKDLLGKMWDWIKGKAQSAVNAEKEKIEKALVGKLKNPEKRQDLVDEVGNMGKIAAASAKFATGGIVDMMAKSAEGAANENEFSVELSINYDEIFEAAFYNAAAQVLDEGYSIEEAELELTEIMSLYEGGHGDGTSAQGLHIPFVSSVMKKLASVPPFNMLHKVEALIAKGTEKGLNGFSKLATKIADAPGPFTFPVMAGIVSIVAGYMIEQKVKAGFHSFDELLVKAIGVGIPGFGIIYKFMKYGGIALATYGLVKNLLGKYKDDEKHDEESKEEKPENK